MIVYDVVGDHRPVPNWLLNAFNILCQRVGGIFFFVSQSQTMDKITQATLFFIAFMFWFAGMYDTGQTKFRR